MKTINIPTIGDVSSSFTVEDGCLMPETEKLSHELRLMLQDMKDAGFQFRQDEDSDFQAIEENMSDFLTGGGFWTWILSIFGSGEKSLPVPLPLPSLPPVLAGVPGIAVYIAVRVVVRLITELLRSYLSPEHDYSEITSALNTIASSVTGVSTSVNGLGVAVEEAGNGIEDAVSEHKLDLVSAIETIGTYLSFDNDGERQGVLAFTLTRYDDIELIWKSIPNEWRLLLEALFVNFQVSIENKGDNIVLCFGAVQE